MKNLERNVPPEICEQRVLDILNDLPDWFGVAENNQQYAAAAAQYDTIFLCEDDQPTACMTLKNASDKTLDIHLLAVKFAHHGNGRGRTLIETAIAEARQNGAVFLTVQTLGPSDPDPAYGKTRAFYGAMGFSLLAEFPEFWHDSLPMALYGMPV